MSVHKAESPFRADILKGHVVLITGGATSRPALKSLMQQQINTLYIPISCSNMY